VDIQQQGIFKMITKAQSAARIGLFKDLTEMQKVIAELWVHKSLPDDWHYLEADCPEVPVRKKVTLYLDQDVAQWYKRMGRGYHDRVNAVLRIYRNAVISGDAKGFDSEYAHGPERVAFLAEAEELFERKLSEMARDGRLTKEGIAKLGVKESRVLDTASAKAEIMRRLDAIGRDADMGDEFEV
jgi:uncharacterized protein (DUF4415 family)